MVTRLPGTFGKASDAIGTEIPIGRAASAGVTAAAQSGSNRKESSSPIGEPVFDVSADRKRIVRCAHVSAVGGESDNSGGDAGRFERDARQAVEEFLRQERESK